MPSAGTQKLQDMQGGAQMYYEPYTAQKLEELRNMAVVHPLLRGGRPSPPHKFSKSQMKVFAAVCDTIFPSLPLDDTSASAVHNMQMNGKLEEARPHSMMMKAELQALEAYLGLSAKDANIRLEAAGNIAKYLKRRDVRLLKLAMWLLSSVVGTLMLGNKNAASRSFPFFGKFASSSLEQRQRLLSGLSRSPLLIKQKLFRCLTNFILTAVFVTVDASGFNPTFRAIHYSVAGDQDQGGCATTSALPSRVIDADEARDGLSADLAALGATIISDVSHLKALQRQVQLAADVEIGVKCDAVVVGSGPGGAVVAAKLAQAGHRVVILEKGRYFQPNQLSHLEGPSMKAMYEGDGCIITDDSLMVLLAGSTLGGGSTINWSASFKTPPHVRREWAESHHLHLFSSSQYDLAMDAVCSRLGVQLDVEHENLQNAVLRAGCKALGYHIDNIPRNSPPDHQCGFCGLGCKQKKKQGAVQTWLEDAASAGAVILTACHAEEVLIKKQKQHGCSVVGIVATVGKSEGSPRVALYVEADVVVAACGALNTPPLLRRSGLSNRAIGKNLHIHPVQLLWGHFDAGSEAASTGHSYEGGIMTAYSNVAANWDTTGYGALIQCPATQPGIISLNTPWTSGREFKSRMLKFSRTAFFIVLTRDQGSGRVNADKDGRLSVRYQLSKADKVSLQEGAEKGLRVLAAAGAREIGSSNADGESFKLEEGCGGITSQQLEAYLARVRRNSFKGLSTMTASAHQMGSCRMGVCPSTSAVRPSGETWEVQGLFVADSSVFPTATGVNPMITVQSIAFCIADAVLLQLQQRRLNP